MSDEAFQIEGQKKFRESPSKPNPKKRKPTESSEEVGKRALKEIAEWIKTLDTGGSVITVAYYFDENKDRNLSLDEFNHMLEKLGFKQLTDVGRDIFNIIDTDQNGKIDYFEFIRAINGVKSPAVEKIHITPKPTRTPSPIPLKSYTGIEVYVGENDLYSWRVLITLKEIGKEYDKIVVSRAELQSESYLQKNSRGQTPTLVVDEIPVFESIAIIKFLVDIYPTNKLAVPSTERVRFAKTLTRLSESDYLSKVTSDAMALTSKPGWEDFKDERAQVEKAVAEEFTRWNSYIGEEGPYVVGRSITLADVAVFPLFAWFYGNFPNVFDEFPKLKRFYELFSGRPSVQETWPEGFQ